MARELLFSVGKGDFIIQTFRSGGKGGQHQNTTNSGVRIIHKESNSVAECRETRHQRRNIKIAFEKLVNSEKFRMWAKLKAYRIMNDFDDIAEEVDKLLRPENLKIEVFKDGKWIVVDVKV